MILLRNDYLQLAQQQQKGRVTRRITAKGYQDYHYDINGRLTQKVVHQHGEITPKARYQRGKLHYVVTDHQGTPREIFSEKGIVSWAGRLNTWGKMTFWQSHDDYADNDQKLSLIHI